MGARVGASLGVALGTPVGGVEGAALGKALGAVEGASLGKALGGAEGATLGSVFARSDVVLLPLRAASSPPSLERSTPADTAMAVSTSTDPAKTNSTRPRLVAKEDNFRSVALVWAGASGGGGAEQEKGVRCLESKREINEKRPIKTPNQYGARSPLTIRWAFGGQRRLVRHSALSSLRCSFKFARRTDFGAPLWFLQRSEVADLFFRGFFFGGATLFRWLRPSHLLSRTRARILWKNAILGVSSSILL